MITNTHDQERASQLKGSVEDKISLWLRKLWVPVQAAHDISLLELSQVLIIHMAEISHSLSQNPCCNQLLLQFLQLSTGIVFTR
jgi:hypothetical protein